MMKISISVLQLVLELFGLAGGGALNICLLALPSECDNTVSFFSLLKKFLFFKIKTLQGSFLILVLLINRARRKILLFEPFFFFLLEDQQTAVANDGDNGVSTPRITVTAPAADSNNSLVQTRTQEGTRSIGTPSVGARTLSMGTASIGTPSLGLSPVPFVLPSPRVSQLR